MEKICAAIKTFDISNVMMYDDIMMYTVHFTDSENADANFTHFHEALDHLRTHNFTASIKRAGQLIATWSPGVGLDMSYSNGNMETENVD